MKDVIDSERSKIFHVCRCITNMNLFYVKSYNVISYQIVSQNKYKGNDYFEREFYKKLLMYREQNVSYKTRLALQIMPEIDYDMVCTQISFLKNSDMLVSRLNTPTFTPVQNIYKNTMDDKIEKLFLSGLSYESIVSLLSITLPENEDEYVTFIANAKNLSWELLNILYDKDDKEPIELLFFEKYITDIIESTSHDSLCTLNKVK